jgi:hypothetical protein
MATVSWEAGGFTKPDHVVLKLQDRPQTGGRGPRQYLDDWLAGSPLVEIVFDDEELRAAAAAAD